MAQTDGAFFENGTEDAAVETAQVLTLPPPIDLNERKSGGARRVVLKRVSKGRRPIVGTNESKDVDNGEVARRAYEIWESRGCPPGDGMEDWNTALAELLSGSGDEAELMEEESRGGVCREIDVSEHGLRDNDGRQTHRIATSPEGGLRVWFARVRRKLIRGDA